MSQNEENTNIIENVCDFPVYATLKVTYVFSACDQRKRVFVVLNCLQVFELKI